MSFISMTGMGYAEASVEDTLITCTFNSVNSRFLDLRINVPPELAPLKKHMHKHLKDKLVRGHIQVTLTAARSELRPESALNRKRLLFYRDLLRTMQDTLGVDEPVGLGELLQFSDQFLVLDIDRDRLLKKSGPVLSCVDKAFSDWRSMINSEGAFIKGRLEEYSRSLFTSVEEVRRHVPRQQEFLKEKVRGWIAAADPEAEIKVESEDLGLMIEKTDITEELDRLTHHLASLDELFAQKDPRRGRKLEFICIELNRELNTIAAKSKIPEITTAAVNGKVTCEQIREQSLNLA